VNVNPAAIEIDGGNVECQQLPESQSGVDGEPERGPVLRAHGGDQLCRFGGRGDPFASFFSRRESKSVAWVELDPASQFGKADQRSQRGDDVPNRGRRPIGRHQPVGPALKLRAL